MSTVASHATGIHAHTAQMASSTTGRPLTGVFEALVAQHREVLDALRQAGESEGARRAERWADARRRLLSHERAEAQTVYALLDEHADAVTLLDQHRRQAEELEAAVLELDETDGDSDAWIGRLRDLVALIDDHVRDEENDFFPRAQRLLGENTARDLEATYTDSQREIGHTLG